LPWATTLTNKGLRVWLARLRGAFLEILLTLTILGRWLLRLPLAVPDPNPYAPRSTVGVACGPVVPVKVKAHRWAFLLLAGLHLFVAMF